MGIQVSIGAAVMGSAWLTPHSCCRREQVLGLDAAKLNIQGCTHNLGLAHCPVAPWADACNLIIAESPSCMSIRLHSWQMLMHPGSHTSPSRQITYVTPAYPHHAYLDSFVFFLEQNQHIIMIIFWQRTAPMHHQQLHMNIADMLYML